MSREATMYSYQECGEVSKASPEPDDIDGMCAIYPIADDPGECRAAGLTRGVLLVGGGGRRGSRACGALPLIGPRCSSWSCSGGDRVGAARDELNGLAGLRARACSRSRRP